MGRLDEPVLRDRTSFSSFYSSSSRIPMRPFLIPSKPYCFLLSSSLALFMSACGVSAPTSSGPTPANPAPTDSQPSSQAPIAAAPQTAPNTSPPTPTVQPLTRNTRLGLTNFGAIQVGMTITNAEAITGMAFEQQASGGEEYGCLYYRVPSFGGLSIMVTEGTIARFELSSTDLTTLSGAKIGYTEGQIQNLYPGQIVEEGHEYVPGGKYLIYEPQDAEFQGYRLVFETDAEGTVTALRSGRVPEVGYIEGCV